MADTLFCGIDVGTGSARAGLFDAGGRCVATASAPIGLHRPAPDYAEQSSSDIWHAVCRAVRAARADADVPPDRIAGIGIDATCSLVAVGADLSPVTVSPTGQDDHNVIVWMDHRAIGQARRIDATGHDVLRFTGNTISPEMEIPKLLWLKEHLPDTWARAAHFFDLPDWLVHRATGSFTRSLCSATCKWTYQGRNGLSGEGWDAGFLIAVGLDDLLTDDAARIGNRFAAPGTPVAGLSRGAADDLGLAPGIPVGASLIDAYAGALGTLGVRATSPAGTRLALVSGTSACHIVTTADPAFVAGVWGPYFGVLGSGRWANEAGQSLAGALIDRIVDGHAVAPALRAAAQDGGQSLYDQLHDMLTEAAGSADATHLLTRNLHVQPDFHGNRAPLADPGRHGAIVGLTPRCDAMDLARQYLATLQALAYGTRQIVEVLNASGVGIGTIVVSGGLAQNPLYLREHADATGCAVLVPTTPEPVLLGSAMLGAVAAGHHATLDAAMTAMSGDATVIPPRRGTVAAFHDAKYAVFLRMQEDFAAYRDLMGPAAPD